DEMGKTQHGNNNAYCQDNEISWIDWKNVDSNLLEFVTSMIRFRKNHPVFNLPKWFKGTPVKWRGIEDIKWFQPSGDEMSEDQWQASMAKSLGVFLNGSAIQAV